MKSADYVVLERIVWQRAPEVFKRESDYVACEQLSVLLTNSGQSWDAIDQVYQFCERRRATTGKQKEFEVVGVYLQGKPGKTDYKFMQGLNFLVPVRSVGREIIDFMNGGWNA